MCRETLKYRLSALKSDNCELICKDVFERCTPISSGLHAFLGSGLTNLVESSYVKKERALLLVDMN